MYNIDLDRKMIMLDHTCYCLYDKVLQYALEHRFNVRCTEVRSSVFAETCLAFQKAGFKIRFEEEHKKMFGCVVTNLVAIFYLDKPQVRELDPVVLRFLNDLMDNAFRATKAYGDVNIANNDHRSAYIQGSSDMKSLLLRELFHSI